MSVLMPERTPDQRVVLANFVFQPSPPTAWSIMPGARGIEVEILSSFRVDPEPQRAGALLHAEEEVPGRIHCIVGDGRRKVHVELYETGEMLVYRPPAEQPDRRGV